ncbi:MAG TPA: polyprenol monophosphomannose synthase [Acidimicrobiales bacterium]|nr:polyprenol monophosphomannose synthase [Acidimicrobiales bacterium]
MRAVVVVPTYEEAGNISALLHQIRATTPSVRVIVVDDNSSDGTASIAESVGEEVGGVEVLRRWGKDGLGAAYQAGFSLALERGADIVVSMDADLSHDPDALGALIGTIEDGADMAIGSRYMAGGRIDDWPAHRRALSQWGNRYANAALQLQLNDATSGYRAYRASVIRDVGLARVRASGYGFLIEMAYRVTRSGGKIVETPITFLDRRWGSSKISIRSIVEAAVLVTVWGARDRVGAFVQRRPVTR